MAFDVVEFADHAHTAGVVLEFRTVEALGIRAL